MHGGPAKFGGLGVKFGSYLRIGIGERVDAAKQRTKIKHRAAGQNRRASGGADRCNMRQCVPSKLTGRIRLVGVDDIYQAMRHSRLFLRVRLGGANVHAAIDQRGVDADQIGRHALAYGHGQRGLAAGRRSHDRDQWPLHGCYWPRRKSRSSSAMLSDVQVGRPWLH